MEFLISKNEIARRKKAFITLLISMTIGIYLGSLLFSYQISIYGYLLVIIAFLFLSIISYNFLNSISRLKIYISEKEIKKTNRKLSESFLLSDIKSIKIKRRTNGIIREIYIFFYNQKELVITAFEENFENIKNLLISKANSNILVKETKEPIDFDHPLFYSILGLPISFMGILFMKLVTNINYSQTKYILFALSAYVFVMGIYFILKKPVSIRSGREQKIIDYVIGLIIACGGIFVFFVGLGL